MPLIYLDHNVIAGVGGIPLVADATSQRAHIEKLSQAGYQFALSAWNIYELARSNNMCHIEQCCEFVEVLSPVWINNNIFIKAQEIDRYLALHFDLIGPVRCRRVTPFSTSIS